MCLVEGTSHVIQNVGMGMLLAQRNVRLGEMDVIMNVNARMDGNQSRMCHVWVCVGMDMLLVQKNVREEGMGVMICVIA